MRILFDTIIVTINIKINCLNNELRQLLQKVQFLNANVQQQSQNFRIDLQSSKKLIVEEIKFFDSTTKNSKLVINLRKHVFYKNICAFVNLLKNVVNMKKKNKLKTIISQCLRDIVLI